MVSFGYLMPTRGIVFASDTRGELTSRAQADIVSVARRAESLGYDALWVGDSVLAKPRFEPLTTLAAVAAATDSVDLGTAVYLPNLRHPVNVAHQTATLDQISGGRLSIGVGVGVRPPERREMEQLGVDYERRGATLDEGLDVIRRLWDGEAVDYDGQFYELDGASIGFSPASTPSVYVASAAFDPEKGFPKQIRSRVVDHGDGWLPITMEPGQYATGLRTLREHVGQAGRDGDDLTGAYYIDVVVADTKDEAFEEARDFLRGYYTEEQVAYQSDEALSEEVIAERGVYGPPSLVAETLAAYRDAGVERFVVRFTAENQRQQLRRFASVADDL